MKHTPQFLTGVPNNDEYIAESLRDLGLLTKSQIDVARAQAGEDGLVQTLVKSGAVSEEDVSRALAAMNSMEFLDLEGAVIEKNIAELVSADDARRYQAMPVTVRDGVLIVALADPMAMQTMDDLTYKLQREIEFVCGAPKAIHKLIVKHHGSADDLLKSIAPVEGLNTNSDEDGDGEAAEGDAPVIKLVSMLLLEAHTNRASDIHIEPLEGKMGVRFRIDGVLQEMQSPPKRLHGAIVSRLKIMSRTMSIAEKRLPQDGRIQIRVGDKSLDLRVSTIPTVHGESVVMRILDKTSLLLGLPDLGFLSDDQAKFEQCINLPDGIILVTGPTGSGKTTTLYAALSRLNDATRNILTVEDPIEYYLDGIGQTQVNPKVDMTFARGLRAILRQDPDVVMVGEIRDLETAQIAVQASLTGHLVLSTLHTNSAIGAVTRLRDMGVEPFLLASSLVGVLAQRLVRRRHSACDGAGCGECLGTGLRGRLGVFELLLVTEQVRSLLTAGADARALRDAARAAGMTTLVEEGGRLVSEGVTTQEEVNRVLVGAL